MLEMDEFGELRKVNFGILKWDVENELSKLGEVSFEIF